MGRLAGFSAGVLLTLATTHLLTTHLHRTAQHNSQTLRQTTLIANSILQPRVPITPLRSYIARPSLVETMKDMWNLEVERGVRWVQGWDLVKIREGVEGVGGVLGGKIRKALSEAGEGEREGKK